MKTFKVGDKVVRTGKDYKGIKKGCIYVVSGVSRNSNKWSCAINLEGHYNKNGEFDYDGNSFELYEENIMSKFKVGDEVKLVVGARNIANNLGNGNIYIVEGIKSDGIKLKGLFPYYHSSLFESVEILKENNMKKFKVGDKVVRVSETYGKAVKGGVYEVSEVSDNEWAGSCGINLKGHEVEGMGKFNYESSCFDLYIDDVLSPLEAAEAILNDEALEEYSNSRGEWCSFSCNLHGITLSYLQQVKLRLKPKTITINEVEVPAPAKKGQIKDYFYVLDISFETIHKVDKMYISNNKNYWATEEDAQKALDAILIPFNELNRGEQQ